MPRTEHSQRLRARKLRIGPNPKGCKVETHNAFRGTPTNEGRTQPHGRGKESRPAVTR